MTNISISASTPEQKPAGAQQQSQSNPKPADAKPADTKPAEQQK